ncbi:hypothetical protein FRX31_011066 [Thalictrum thalictroides]|uniref:RNase H type-1 domain-containing protein n=1 Tax=Thalictrum thalictroides TaxID=46969 RepID=A0A7J6WR02_THATH|nr:hypothetical protein FRX31_011066 [Thalictrum thalictroides]
MNPTRVGKKIDLFFSRHFKKIVPQKIPSIDSIPETIWIPPPQGYHKMNVDISFRSHDASIGICYITRTNSGNFIFAGTETGHATSAEEGECKGLQAAVRAGLQQQLKRVVFETDSKNVAAYLAGHAVNISWTSSIILDQVKQQSMLFDYVFFLFCNRSGNECAQILATLSASSTHIPCNFLFPPDCLKEQLRKDLIFCNSVNS